MSSETTDDKARAAIGANVVARRYKPRIAPSTQLRMVPSCTRPAGPPRPPIDTKRAWSPSSLLRTSSSAQAQASRTVAPALTMGGSGVNALDQALYR